MISVCVATYNGAKFIREQIESILNQLGPLDELIVCDDGSVDETTAILKNFKDLRIQVHVNPIRLGHVRNFEKTLKLAKGEHIFLADQDDIWLPGRVAQMVESLESAGNTLLVASNFNLIDASGAPVGIFRKLGKVRKYKIQQLAAIFAGRAPYFGCTFLMNRRCLQLCLPIPSGIESHDIWIALVASSFGKVINLPGATLLHRIHGSNMTATSRRGLVTIAKSRWVFFCALVTRMSQRP